MTLTLELNPQLEEQLRREAARLGLGPDDYVVRALSDRLKCSQPPVPHLTAKESSLLEQIDLGLTQRDWARYHELTAKLHDETMSPEEHAELITLTDRIEANNVRRLKALIELSSLRGVPLEQLMRELGIFPQAGRDTNG